MSKRLKLSNSKPVVPSSGLENAVKIMEGIQQRSIAPATTYVESMSQTLDLHNTMPTQGVITNSRLEQIAPVNSIDDARFIQFKLSTMMNDLIHPTGCFLALDLEIVSIPTTANPDFKKVIPVNGIGGALFKNLIVKLNGKQIESGDGLYGYRADLEKRLLYPEGTKLKGNMDLNLYSFPEYSFDCFKQDDDPWFPEFSYEVEENDAPVDGAGEENEAPGDGAGAGAAAGAPQHSHLISKIRPNLGNGNVVTNGIEQSMDGYTVLDTVKCFQERLQFASYGQKFKVIDVIHSNLFNQSKHLPPNSKLELTFDLQDNEAFYLLSKEDDLDGKIKIKIHNAYLWARIDTIDPDVALKMVEKTQSGQPFRFPIRRVDMNYLTRPENINDLSESAALLKDTSRIPRRIFIAICEQTAFHGNLKKDPFHYKDVNANNIELKIGGQQRPLFELRSLRPTNPNDITIKQQPDMSQFLFSLKLATGTYMSNVTLGINRKNFLQGNFIIGFDLTSGDTEESFEFPEQKNVELFYHLSSAITSAHTMIIYAEYDGEYQIDQYGKVTII